MYKRQILLYMFLRGKTVSQFRLSAVTREPREFLQILAAVSYTHLDVYKRQDLSLLNCLWRLCAVFMLLWQRGGTVKKQKTCLLYTSRCV